MLFDSGSFFAVSTDLFHRAQIFGTFSKSTNQIENFQSRISNRESQIKNFISRIENQELKILPK